MIGVDQIRIGALAGPLEATATRGHNIKDILSDFKLSSRILANAEAPIETGIYLDFLDRCTRVSGDKLFCLQSGLNQDLRQLGLLGQTILKAPTIREALECAQIGIQYIQGAGALNVSVQRERCIVRYQHKFDGPLSRYDVDYTVGLLANIIKIAKASVQGNLKLYFPSASTAFTPVQTVRCIGSTDGIVEFDKQLLNSPMALYEEATFYVLEHFHRICVNQSYRTTGFEGIVECILTAMIGKIKPSLQATSMLLGIGERKLQRQLRRERTSFRELRDRVRQKAALHDIALGKSMTDIAFKLGYDHSSNFSTAFRRWFGQQPSTYQFDFRDP
jgi:AraC-like DNA-binding protein